MDSITLRWRHSPLYDLDHPVYPDAPQVPSPLFILDMRQWHWEVEVEVHTLQYFVQGRGCYEFPDSESGIARGSCFLFRPGDRVRGYALDDRPVTIFSAHLARIPEDPPGGTIPRTTIRELGLFESLAVHVVRQRQKEGDRARREVTAGVETLYHLFLDNLSREAKPAVQARVEDLTESIRADLAADWSVDRMCDEVDLSRSQLTRWFKTLTRMSPTRFVIHHRVARAVQLITMTNRPLQEVARELGYRDVHFFSRQFTSVMGRSPGQFRGRGA